MGSWASSELGGKEPCPMGAWASHGFDGVRLSQLPTKWHPLPGDFTLISMLLEAQPLCRRLASNMGFSVMR